MSKKSLSKPNIVQRIGQGVAHVFAPKASIYQNASSSSRRRQSYSGKPRDAHKELTTHIRNELVQTGRGVTANSGQAAQIELDYRIYCVPGEGFSVKPMTENEDWNLNAKEYFDNWAMLADASGRFNLTELCVMGAGLLPSDGEFFGIKTFVYGEPAIQLCETHQVSSRTNKSERLIDGIVLNRQNRPKSYLFLDSENKEVPVKASAVMHVFDPKRPTLWRNPPEMQHSLDKITDVHEIIETETTLIKVLQDIARVLKSDEQGKVQGKEFEIDISNFRTATSNDDETEVTLTAAEKIEQATGTKTVQIGVDEELAAIEHNRPNAQFLELMRTLKKDANQGILPFEFSYDPNGVNGGALRLVVTKADRILNWKSRILINRWMQKIWFFVIGDAIDRGRLEPQPKWNKVQIAPPKRLTADFGRDEAQNRLNVEGGLKTERRNYEEQGWDLDKERATAIADARKLLDECGYPKDMPIPLYLVRKITGMTISEAIDSAIDQRNANNNQEDDES